jgi:hypothetical protein
VRCLIAGEALSELDGFVNSYLGGHVLDVEHLEEREAQNRAVDGAHAVNRPSYGDVAEKLV